MKTVVVIGGGISGLAATHRLLELSRQQSTPLAVILLEGSSRLGGIIQTQHRDGFLLERGPDSFISEKPEALQLAKRLNLDSQLIETNPDFRRSFIVRDKRLVPVPPGFHLIAPGRLIPFLSSEVFSWRGKARMAMDLLLPRRSSNGVADESLASFVRRRLGSEALERMAQPMVGGIYNADPERLSLKATMPRFLEMEAKHGSLIRALRRQLPQAESTSGARYSMFLSFDKGMQVLTDTLVQEIARGPAKIKLNQRVCSLELTREDSGARWAVKTEDGATLLADGICLALPAPAVSKLVNSFDEGLAIELEGILSASTITINLAYRRKDINHPLDGFGFVVPFIEKLTVMACTFASVKFKGRAPQDHVLLRAFVGGTLQPELFELDDTELLRRVQADLQTLLKVSQPPLFAEISRWENSMPQYDLGHLERVQRIHQRASGLPTFALAGNAYGGPGIPDCIRSGEAAAESIMKSLIH